MHIFCLLVLILYVIIFLLSYLFFFFKQKTAYEMRISDWSSDVCSSDLVVQPEQPLDRALIQIRREIAERLEAKGLCLEWNASADSQPLPPPQLHALRSILRETVSNAIKHSACTMLRIKLTAQGGTLDILVEDEIGRAHV